MPRSALPHLALCCLLQPDVQVNAASWDEELQQPEAAQVRLYFLLGPLCCVEKYYCVRHVTAWPYMRAAVWTTF